MSFISKIISITKHPPTPFRHITRAIRSNITAPDQAKRSTHIPLYKMSLAERQQYLGITQTTPQTPSDTLSPNIIGLFQLPLGVATKFDTFRFLALEEPSVLAGASALAGKGTFNTKINREMVQTTLSLPIKALGKQGKPGLWYAQRVMDGFKLGQAISQRAVTGNKGGDNAIGPYMMARYQQSHEVSSRLHFDSRHNGTHPETGESQYGPHIQWQLTDNVLQAIVRRNILSLPSDLPSSQLPSIFTQPLSAKELTQEINEIELAQHAAAMLSLASKGGISANHMPHHHRSEQTVVLGQLNPDDVVPPSSQSYTRRQAMAATLGIPTELLTDTTSLSTLDGLIEQCVNQLSLPFSVFNVAINGTNEYIPWAGILNAPTILDTLSLINRAGTLNTTVTPPAITGQVQLKFQPNSAIQRDKLADYIQSNWSDYQEKIICRDKEIDTSDHHGKIERMQQRGGFLPDINTILFGSSDAVVHFSLNPAEAMGANLIDRAAEIFGELLEEDLNVQSIFRILTNDHSNCLSTSTVTILKSQLQTVPHANGANPSAQICDYLQSCYHDEESALKINTLLTQAVIAQGIATGQDTRALTATLHLFAMDKGQCPNTGTPQYGPLVSVKETDTELLFTLRLPTRLTSIGRMNTLHEGVKASMRIIGQGNKVTASHLASQMVAFPLALVIDHCLNVTTKKGPSTPPHTH